MRQDGAGGAAAATLTFMCGGEAAVFGKIQPILDGMGKNLVHAGGPGMGQAAKICNNMLAGIGMVAVAEAFVLGEKLGLDLETLFNIVSTSSGDSFVLQRSCPVPGLNPNAASSNGFKPGFAAALMAKDLRLSQAAARGVGSATPLGAQASAMFDIFAGRHGELDSSGIIKLIRGDE